jgi:hypothetical protein
MTTTVTSFIAKLRRCLAEKNGNVAVISAVMVIFVLLIVG